MQGIRRRQKGTDRDGMQRVDGLLVVVKHLPAPTRGQTATHGRTGWCLCPRFPSVTRRAGQTARRRAWAKTREAIWSWRSAALALALAAGFLIAVGLWYLATEAVSDRPSATATAFVLGGALISVPWALAMILMSVDGSMAWRLGADGEEHTASELNRLGGEWQVRHNVSFAVDGGTGEIDVDHVAIGPYGVLVVESKWCTGVLDLDRTRPPTKVLDAIKQVRGNVGRVGAVLSRQLGDAQVIPVVVYWGRSVTGPTDGVRRLDEVRIVRGDDSERWRPRLQGNRLSVATQEALVARLDEVIARYEQARRSTEAEEAKTTSLTGWSRHLAIAAISVSLLEVVSIGVLDAVDVRAPRDALSTRLAVLALGIIGPLLLSSLVLGSVGIGLLLRDRSARWWRWPAVVVGSAAVTMGVLFIR